MNGLLGAMTISSAPSSASSTPGAGVAVASPSKRTRSTSSRCCRATNHSWNGKEPAGVSIHVRSASSVAGSSVTSTPRACRQPAGHRRQRLAAAQRLRADEVEAEVAVAELEPRLSAEPGDDFHRLPGLVRPPPPALLVRDAGERVEDAVEVRRDVEAEHLDVVADVADHRHASTAPRPRRGRAGTARRRRRRRGLTTLRHWTRGPRRGPRSSTR